MKIWEEKYFSTEGRLNRKLYIRRLLKVDLLGIAPQFIFFLIGGPQLVSRLFAVLLFYQCVIGISLITLMIRRLHDLNHSGWWWLLSFIPFINCILLIYVLCFKGTVGSNRFGQDPLGEKVFVE